MGKYKAQQNEAELAEFVQLLKQEGIKSYLEIGCKWGGTFWEVAQILPKGARMVGVDLPQPNSGTLESLAHCVIDLRNEGFDARMFYGNSVDRMIVAKVTALGPYDACLIDANHTMEFVRKDWENYGPIARIVAFHDISWKGPRPGRLPVNVPEFWAELKKDHSRIVEIQKEPRDNGFGILWRQGQVPGEAARAGDHRVRGLAQG